MKFLPTRLWHHIGLIWIYDWSSQLYTQLKTVVKLKPEKNSGLNGIWTHDLCDAGAVLSYQAICMGAGHFLKKIQAWTVFEPMTSAMPVQCWAIKPSAWELVTLWVRKQLLKLCITAKINHGFISFSEVQIYDLSYIHLRSLPSTGILKYHSEGRLFFFISFLIYAIVLS